jgi:formimidoylglutamate deiminase
MSPCYIEVGDDGMILDLTDAPAPAVERAAESFAGFALPGMPNVHSHAYARALAGFAEPTGRRSGDFWSWRERMYDLALRLEPDEVEAISAQAFVEMTKAGFTSVAEFHYLHHQRDGTRYADPAEISRRVIAASEAAGIGLTLLPALYMHSGVDAPLDARQHRFGSASVDEYMSLIASIAGRQTIHDMLRVGVAPHSVRAVTESELQELLTSLEHEPQDMPVHMHLAEQQREVDESLARRGERPGDWLGRRVDLSARWTLVHATHCGPEELVAIARSGATVGLCPVTEANLGDGLFPLPASESLRGRWGIGTDANTTIGVAAELRMLEYGQRAALARRDVHPDAVTSAGELLFAAALEGGGRAVAQPVGSLARGKRADLVVYDPGAAWLVGHGTRTFMDALLMGGGTVTPTAVMVGGEWVVREGRHIREEAIGRRFAAVMRRLY